MGEQRIAIYCFSGTGNTEFVVKLLAGELEARGCQAEVVPITAELLRQAEADRVDTASADMVGIAHPVHAWAAPQLVDEFIQALPPGNGKPAFLLRTAAGNAFSGGATTGTRRLLHDRGYEIFYEALVLMPGNIFTATPVAQAQEMVETARERAGDIATELLAGQERLTPNPVGNRIVTRLLGSLEQSGTSVFGKNLTASDACTRCGLCVRRCPAENISIADGELPQFHESCLMCLRCIYACPVEAITSQALKFVIVEGGYDLERYLG